MPKRAQQIVELSQECIEEIGLDGCVQSINPRGVALLGAADALPGRVWLTRWRRSAQGRARDAWHAATRGEARQFEATTAPAGGGTRAWRVALSPLRDAEGEIDGILAVSQDITEARRIEQALFTLNQTLQTDLRISGDHLRRANHLADDLSERLQASEQQARSDEAQSALLLQQRMAAEEQRDIALVARDAAELIATQAQKGEAVGQLLAGVVHDLNNVLQAATGAIDLVLAREQLDAYDSRALRLAESALQHGATMAQRLLGFARAHPFEPASIDLDALVERLAPLLRQALGSAIDFVVAACGQACCARLDPHSLERALMNLVVNARDACEGGGTVTVSTSVLHIAASESSLERPSGDYVAVSVQDTGAGIAPEVKRRLFEAYFTTKPRGKGTGLGLAQVYGAVRQASGFIDVESAPGQGARFTLAFPKL